MSPQALLTPGERDSGNPFDIPLPSAEITADPTTRLSWRAGADNGKRLWDHQLRTHPHHGLDSSPAFHPRSYAPGMTIVAVWLIRSRTAARASTSRGCVLACCAGGLPPAEDGRFPRSGWSGRFLALVVAA